MFWNFTFYLEVKFGSWFSVVVQTIYSGAIDWKLYSPNSYVEILTPNVMVLGDGASGRWLGHEGIAQMNEVNALVKETPDSSLVPFAMWGYNEKMAIYEPGNGFSPDTESAGTELGLSSLQTERNKFLLFINHSVFVIAAQMD